MTKHLFGCVLFLWPCLSLAEGEQPVAPLSEASQECLECHSQSTPGIVHDWMSGAHARVTMTQALAKPALARRVSADKAPPGMEKIAVGCYECHSLRADKHKDNFEHNGYQINVVVTPEDCRVCHPIEVEQYSGSKKAHAVGILDKNPLFSTLVNTVDGVVTVRGKRLIQAPPSAHTRGQTCFACHGTKVEVIGKKIVETADGEMEFPVLSNWPNQGVGRLNPDGSMGACSACHPRHGFSLAVARRPQTCGQCHLEPDVPAYNVYMESKHGNIFAALGAGYSWDEVPWRVGKDFRSPTCAACHNSLLASPEGAEIVPRTHDFGARLWVRLFGLPYSHAQPEDGRTYLLKNADGLPLPTSFGGQPALTGLIGPKEQAARKATMGKVCSACHGGRWIEGHFAAMDAVNRDTDQMVKAATQLLSVAWKKKLANKKNPFDETIERLWTRQWLFYASSVRYAAAMSGPDYASFKNGWWYLTENLQKMHQMVYGKKRR